jgi:uncharacterized membrane protein YdjX (TVP38/TMEM64 family)
MGKHAGKILLLALLAAIFAAFWALGLNRYLTLSFIRSSSDASHAAYAAHPVLTIAAYFSLYVVCAALSLPGAVVLTIAAGALFGLVGGTLIASFASAIGATIACFVSRYLLRSWVQERLGPRAGRINEGVDKEGAFYLFTLRLIPIFPFWMINLAMGLTTMALPRFYWVSQLGMLAGTIVYVNAGRELAGVTSLKEILSPGLVISFVLIGILPLAAKKSLALYRARKHVGHEQAS